MNNRQAKKKQRNRDRWWEDFAGATYGYRNNRVMNRKYHEFCIRQERFINRNTKSKIE